MHTKSPHSPHIFKIGHTHSGHVLHHAHTQSCPVRLSCLYAPWDEHWLIDWMNSPFWIQSTQHGLSNYERLPQHRLNVMDACRWHYLALPSRAKLNQWRLQAYIHLHVIYNLRMRWGLADLEAVFQMHGRPTKSSRHLRWQSLCANSLWRRKTILGAADRGESNSITSGKEQCAVHLLASWCWYQAHCDNFILPIWKLSHDDTWLGNTL